MNPRHANAVDLGGSSAIALFVFVLLAFVAESQLTQYVQVNLGFRQPFFLFYIVHSWFLTIFPVHFLILSFKYDPRALWKGLMYALSQHLSPVTSEGASFSSSMFPARKALRLILCLTAGVTVPSLLWFIAVSLAPITDVTALWNTNAFFAYIVTVKVFKLDWEPRRLMAVILATLGAMAVIYSGSGSEEKVVEISSSNSPRRTTDLRPTAPMLGDFLTLLASIGYGVYQVMYKVYAALPSDPEVQADPWYTPIDSSDNLPDVIDESLRAIPQSDIDMVYPPPFGLYPNLLTSAIGVCTMLILWIPLPILHISGAESFQLPDSMATTLTIVAIAVTGVIFNSGFMVLLGVWGPIITSVGNLLTIVLVFISDIIFVGVQNVKAWSLLGCSSIVVAFGVLAYDMRHRRGD